MSTKTGILGFVALCLMLMACVTASAATINVPADQPTIQAAINAAADGDTIVVADGVYAEWQDGGYGNSAGIIVDKSLTLSGSGAGCIIRGKTGTISNMKYSPLLWVKADDVEITGFTFDGATVTEAERYGLSGMGILSAWKDATGGDCAATSLNVHHNTFTFIGSAVTQDRAGGGNITVANNTMVRETRSVWSKPAGATPGSYIAFTSGGGGVKFDYVNGGTVRDNSGIQTVGVGIFLRKCTGLTVGPNNVITGAGDPEDAGMHLQDCTNVTVTGNTISGFTGGGDPYYTKGKKGAGVHIYAGCDGITVEKNTISGNSVGVYAATAAAMTSPTNVTIVGNNFTGNTDYAVLNIKYPASGTWNYCDYDLFSAADSDIDARENWWGSPDGPSGGVNDPVTGRMADGSGDRVSANVLFDPWIGFWTLTVASDPAGIISAELVVPNNAVVPLFAPARSTLAGKRYNFVKWSTGETSNSIDVTVKADTTVTAEYAIQKWALSVNSTPVTGFAITGDKPGVTGTTDYPAVCDDQDVVSLTAPDPFTVGTTSYRFVNWSTGATSLTINVTMTSNKAVTANYIAAWTLSVNSTGVSAVAIIGSDTFGGTTDYTKPVNNNTSVTLTAPQIKMVGDVEYKFVRWTGGSDNVLSTTVLMTDNITATAEYALPTWMPSVVWVDDAWADPDQYPNGTQVTVDGNIKVIGYNAFATIQGGVNGVAGSTVNVAAGTYAENIVIGKTLELIGSGSGSDPASDTIINGGGGIAVLIAAGGASASDRLVLKDFRVAGGSNGLRTDSDTDYITLENVFVTGCSSYGFEIHNTADVDDLVMTDCSFNANGSIGMRVRGSLSGLVASGCHFDGSTADSGSGIQSVNAPNDGTVFTNVQFTDCTFNDNPQKGMYFEKLDNATFTNITVLNSGTAGATASGIDVNVKYGTYENIKFTNPTVTNCGTGNSDSGTGIVVKGRNDGSYATCPASLTNVSISGGSVTGCPIGVSFGNNVSNISLSGGASITGTDIGAAVWTDPSSPAVDLGDTSFGGGLATYVGVGTAMNVTATSAKFTGAADNFAIEDRVYHKLDDLALGLVTWVPANVYVTPDSGSIQRGITAVVGSTVNVAAGIYDESPKVSVPAGKDGLTLTGTDATILNTSLYLYSNNVSVSGFTFQNGAYIASQRAGIYVAANGAIIVRNEFRDIKGVGGAAAVVDTMALTDGNNMLVEDNEFVGCHMGVYVQRADNVTIKKNTFSGSIHCAIGSHLVSNVTVEYNDIDGAGSTDKIGWEVFESTVGIAAHYNNFLGNVTALQADGASQVSAENNWWGSYGGPGVTEFGRVGGAVTGNVTISPITLGQYGENFDVDAMDDDADPDDDNDGYNDDVEVLAHSNPLDANSVARKLLTVTSIPSGADIEIDPTSPDSMYDYGTVVTLTADDPETLTGSLPNQVHDFTGWTVNEAPAGNANPLVLSMDEDKDVEAKYTPRTWTLTVKASFDNLHIKGIPDGFSGDTPYTRTADDQTQVTLEAPAALNVLGVDYKLLYWIVDGVPQTLRLKTVQVTMDDDHEVVAVYTPAAILELDVQNIVSGEIMLYVKPGDVVTVHLNVLNLQQPVPAAQVILGYEPEWLSQPAVNKPLVPLWPWLWPDTFVLVTPGEIDFTAGIMYGETPPSTGGTMAVITFTVPAVTTYDTTYVVFRPNVDDLESTWLIDDENNLILSEKVPSQPIMVDGALPVPTMDDPVVRPGHG